jgi:hypothetical protein
MSAALLKALSNLQTAVASLPTKNPGRKRNPAKRAKAPAKRAPVRKNPVTRKKNPTVRYLIVIGEPFRDVEKAKAYAQKIANNYGVPLHVYNA